MNAVNPPVLSCCSRTLARCSTRSSSDSTCPNIIVTVEGIPSRWAWSMTAIQSPDDTLSGEIFSRTASTRISPPPPGDGVEPRLLQPVQDLVQRAPAHMDDVLDLRRRKRVDVEGGVAFLEGSQQIFVPFQGKRGVMAPLHQDAGTPQLQGLLDLLEENLLGVEVPLRRVPRKPVEGAEGALGDADVGVVD